MAVSPALAARVSRRELALNRRVWLAQAAMFAVVTIATVILALGPFGFDPTRLLLLTSGLAVVTAAFLLLPPQPVDSIGNHLAVASSYVGTGVAMFASAPQTAAAAAAIMFTGPLASMRLVDRREISGHLVLATACVLAPALYAHLNAQGLIGMATLVVGMWVLGGCCVVVLEAAERQGEALEKLVRRDPLTGVGNRRMLTEELARALRRHQRSRRQLSLLAIDLDGFKLINDTLGHAAGDDLLVRVAEALVSTVPSSAVVTRAGGDEFAVVLADTSPEDAQRVAAAVRVALAACGTTAGIGIASFPRDAVHDKVLAHLADQRLQDDKAAPRGAASQAVNASLLRVVPDERKTA